MDNIEALAAFINSLFIAWVCICRLNVTNVKVLPSVRFKYVMMMVGSLAFGGQPFLWGEYPSTGGLILQFCITASLIVSYRRWQFGPPADTLIDSAKFSRR